jgi:hypothetical protein
MPERKYNLRSQYDRLDDQIAGDVLDSIVIGPRSHGWPTPDPDRRGRQREPGGLA